MRPDWHWSGESQVREAVEEAVSALPREHLRRLEALIVQDDDPKGRSLGIWRQDHAGCAIEIYVQPHVDAVQFLPAPVRDFALRLHLAYTIFHEAGHHVTRVLNPRATPPRKAPRVEEKIEKWADEYAEKRLQKLCDRWLSPEGRADTPEARHALSLALRALRLDKLIRLPADAGTKPAGSSSETRYDFPLHDPGGESPLT